VRDKDVDAALADERLIVPTKPNASIVGLVQSASRATVCRER
jgi:methenyltetrahydromethanopterin cyclohydrolase